MTIQTPNNIDILLHFHCSRTPHERAHSLAVAEAIHMLFEAGAISPLAEPGAYETTAKGKAWVEALCRVEEPRQAWIDSQGNVLA